ncbi:hypothetical protein [Corynebacterium lubricantis]|uniref:hypothetical protein n=1 Tax=Corynebacterium lubricantis TaxID=541095 RepID=UPI00037A6E84|nr:hypothetical protein [Corynebacterium lubricantis]
MRVRSLVASVAAATLLGFSVPVASGQIPEGLDPLTVQSIIPSTVPVPAGTTTTVDLGVPVEVAYNDAGWSVSSSGTGVTVTAPNEPGSQISVPVTAGDYSATITLVAEGDSGAPDSGLEPEPAPVPAPAPAPAPATPERQTASTVDSSQAKKLYLDGVVEDNVLRVQLSINQISDVMPLVNASRDGRKLRYLDINGQIIKNVEREIKVTERSITLTYPAGETPDNPFIMEVVRDDTVAEFYAIITASNAPVAQPKSDGNQEGSVASMAQDTEAASEQQSSSIWWIAGGVIALVLVLGGVFVWRMRR